MPANAFALDSFTWQYSKRDIFGILSQCVILYGGVYSTHKAKEGINCQRGSVHHHVDVGILWMMMMIMTTIMQDDGIHLIGARSAVPNEHSISDCIQKDGRR